MNKVLYFLAGALTSLSVSAQTFDPTTEICAPKHRYTTKLVPDSAQFTRETVHYPDLAPLLALGFDHLVAWMTVVTVDGCINQGDTAKAQVLRLEIIERTATGVEQVIQRVDYQSGTAWLEGKTFVRYPKWYDELSPEQPYLMWPLNGGYVMDVTSVSRRIWHPWTQPRLPINPGSRYTMLVTMTIKDPARVQIGFDTWRGSDSPDIGWSEGCLTSNNCQVGASAWYGAGSTSGKQITIRFPK
jgi:hypothetical protein